jgi:hypothetical protein
MVVSPGLPYGVRSIVCANANIGETKQISWGWVDLFNMKMRVLIIMSSS